MARPTLSALALALTLAPLAALASCSSSDEPMPAGTTSPGGDAGQSGQAGQAGQSGQAGQAGQGAGGGAGSSGEGGQAGANASPHPCVDSFGTAMSSAFGRLDGTLYSAVIPPNQSCAMPNADHLILEVAMGGAYYRLLINVQSDTPGQDPRVLLAEVDGPPLPGGPYSEGWHTAVPMDYPSTIPIHADAFTPYELDALVAKVMGEVEFDAPISVYLFGYGPDGGHKIHRNGQGHDGAVVLRPTSDKPRYLLFRFDGQSF